MNGKSHMGSKISVVMPCYNSSRWLGQAIESVLNQTYINFELIIVDDGSTDDTLKIIKYYKNLDSRIVPIIKKNTGLSDSLNMGISVSTGEWIARIDSDDICEPMRFYLQMQYIKKYPQIVLLGACSREIDENGVIINNHRYPENHSSLVKNLVTLKKFFPHSSAFYRADIVKKINGYNKRFHRAEDCKLWLDFSNYGRIACHPELLVRIRKHNSQISNDDNGRRQLCDAIAAVTCYLLVQKNFLDPSIDLRDSEWECFLGMIERAAKSSGIFARRNVWKEARSIYMDNDNKLIRGFNFFCHILFSGHFLKIFFEKIYGLNIPKKSMNQWIAANYCNIKK